MSTSAQLNEAHASLQAEADLAQYAGNSRIKWPAGDIRRDGGFDEPETSSAQVSVQCGSSLVNVMRDTHRYRHLVYRTDLYELDNVMCYRAVS